MSVDRQHNNMSSSKSRWVGWKTPLGNLNSSCHHFRKRIKWTALKKISSSLIHLKTSTFSDHKLSFRIVENGPAAPKGTKAWRGRTDRFLRHHIRRYVSMSRLWSSSEISNETTCFDHCTSAEHLPPRVQKLAQETWDIQASPCQMGSQWCYPISFATCFVPNLRRLTSNYRWTIRTNQDASILKHRSQNSRELPPTLHRGTQRHQRQDRGLQR